MNARTTEELYDYLSDELTWRKKELSILHSLTEQGSSSKRKALLRSTITLLYAHWEGFIKSAGTAYIQFVANQRLSYSELSDNFLALSIRPKLHKATNSKKALEQIKLVEFFRDNLNNRSNLQAKEIINTESNLASPVFKNIIEMLGFNYSLYATNEKLIDTKLLKTRNTVAHGEYLNIDHKEFLEVYDKVITMMDTFRNEIDNAASQQAYRK